MKVWPVQRVRCRCIGLATDRLAISVAYMKTPTISEPECFVKAVISLLTMVVVSILTMVVVTSAVRSG